MLMLIIPRLVDSISIDSQVVAIHLVKEGFTLSNLFPTLNVNEDIQDYTNEPYGLLDGSHEVIFIMKYFWFALRSSLSSCGLLASNNNIESIRCTEKEATVYVTN